MNMLRLGRCAAHCVVNTPQRLVALTVFDTKGSLIKGEEDLVAGKLKLVISEVLCLNYQKIRYS